MKRISFFLILLFAVQIVGAQAPEDSVKIAKANWSPRQVSKGVIHKHAPFKYLYGVAQNVNVVEISPAKKSNLTGLIINEPLEKTSVAAQRVEASAAINGSYYDTKKGNSVCFLKIGPDVMDTTTQAELNRRVTGAMRIDKGQLSLIPWDRQIEKQYDNKEDIILASGPLMLDGGNVCDFSVCDSSFINTRHPRSAIGITPKGQILLVVVDGRATPHAEGMNIPELAFLMKMLGCSTALNLDGGGSSTLWAAFGDDNAVLNMPSDNKRFDHDGERMVANVIYFK